MSVGIGMLVVAVAELIAHTLMGALYHMHGMVLAQQGQGARHNRLVDGDEHFLYLAHREGPSRPLQCLHHQDAVGRGPYAMVDE